jgi:sulfhydrogenase subunit beta (sulfur reductase)
MGSSLKVGDKAVIAARELQRLFEALRRRGYQLVGPTRGEGDLVYGELTAVSDLPVGWTDEQEGGAFRLKPRGDQALFGYGVGQDSWKKFLFPSALRLWQARRSGAGWQILPENPEIPKFGFIGVRACDLHAIAVQDRVFMTGEYADPAYKSRRQQAFVVAVNCGGGSCGTCFCVSMGTGPKATFGFDLALTEVLQDKDHYLVVEVGTGIGAEVLKEVPGRAAQAGELAAAAEVVAVTARRMGRVLDTTDLQELLYRNYENPRWDDVAGRCLTCGNCTMVCPTCFCHTIEDFTDLTGELAERWRRLDVCFTVDFSYIHGGSIRATPRSRYRQWLTHKLATWIDQFGCSGCIGCGRCITWCPVAIDITEEARAIRESDAAATTSATQEP